jgi:integrase
MGGRKRNGEGTISGPRKDGRYVGAFYAPTTAGTVKRVYVYGRSYGEAREKLIAEQAKVMAGIPVPAQSWKLGPYLDYWLEHVVKPTRRPATVSLYETCIRLHLQPGLGTKELRRLSVAVVQKFLNAKLAEIEPGESIRLVHVLRQVLSAALSRAVREELISRNVARLVELPPWEAAEVVPWSAAEALSFLAASQRDPLYPAFVLLLLYGMRRGEVLGLRWSDIEDNRIRVRQQVQRIKGKLIMGPVKTRAGRRDLPLLGLADDALMIRRGTQFLDSERLGDAWTDTGLVFTTRTGLPLEPRNLNRSFERICDANGIRRIKVHAMRHTAASLLKVLGVPPKDVQVILGHAHASTTNQIYTHVDETAMRDALTRLNRLLGGNDD